MLRGLRNRRTGFLQLVIVAVVAAAFTAIGVQGAMGAGAITVSGVQLDALPGSECDTGKLPGEIAYVMTGDLVGCWYTTTSAERGPNPGGGYQATGTERFVGCLDLDGDGCADEATGVFGTTFTFTAKYDGPVEIHGRCQHPLVPERGTGVFAGARGIITFKDFPGRYPYRGNITLG